MNEDIKELVEDYKKYDVELERKMNEFDIKEKNIIGSLVIITKKDNWYCEELLEKSYETTISLLERIPEMRKVVDGYRKIRDEVIDIRTKKNKTSEKIAMIIRQITGCSIENCRSIFKINEYLWFEVLEYIDKLEKR